MGIHQDLFFSIETLTKYKSNLVFVCNKIAYLTHKQGFQHKKHDNSLDTYIIKKRIQELVS